MTTKERQEKIREILHYVSESKEAALDAYAVVHGMLGGYDDISAEELRKGFSYSDLRRKVRELSDDDLETLAIREARKG